jgi:hypothetical protein
MLLLSSNLNNFSNFVTLATTTLRLPEDVAVLTKYYMYVVH